MKSVLDSKTQELSAIAASIAAHCQPCFEYHIKMAKEAGATPSEIRAVIKLAGMIREAGNKNMDEFVDKIIKLNNK